MLRARNLTSLLRNETVRTTSFARILTEQRVRSIGYLKIDVEGAECKLLASLEAACTDSPSRWPRLVAYEEKHLDHAEVQWVSRAGLEPTHQTP